LARDHFIGVDLGGTKILAEVIDRRGQIRSRAKRETPFRGDGRDLVAALSETIEEAIGRSPVARTRIAAIGLGSPGPLDPDRGILLRTPHIAARRVPLGKRLGERFGVPVILDNDVHMAVLGELEAGAARGCRSVVGLWVGTGVGGCVIQNGRVVQGINKNAGEIGHMYLDAKRAVAGREKGTLEWEASKTGMTRHLEKEIRKGKKTRLSGKLHGDERLHSSDLAKAFRAKDKLAVEAVRHSARYLGIAIANLFNALAPELFVLGGGVVEDVGSPYVALVREHANAFAFSTELSKVRVVASKLKDDAGPIGAAAAARRKLAASGS
jgi:glucokinase